MLFTKMFIGGSILKKYTHVRTDGQNKRRNRGKRSTRDLTQSMRRKKEEQQLIF